MTTETEKYIIRKLSEIETERGSGMVRFVLTRQGLEMMQNHEPPTKKPARMYLN